MSRDMDKAEQRFLESQKARLDAIHSRKTERSNGVSIFWESLKERLSRWNGKLEELNKSFLVAPTAESEKRSVNLKLLSLGDDLRELRRHCLQTNSLLASCENDTSLPPLPEYMPSSDLKLLHNEFVQLQTRLDETKKRLLPKGKFVFKRYRQAMANRTENSNTTPEMIRRPKPSNLSLGGDKMVEGLRDCEIVTSQTGDCVSGPQDFHCSSPSILHDIERSQILFRHSLDSLHIVGVRQSQIRIECPVSRAVHVTDCHETKLILSCHQLRIHNSSDVECQVTVGSGAILEGCKGIVLRSDQELDIRDFNWLCSDHPSPNFKIVSEPKVLDRPEVSRPAGDTHCGKGTCMDETQTEEIIDDDDEL